MIVKSILERVQNLPPMPAMAVRLLEAANNPDVELSRVAQWIEKDPSMTANLLRLCNSPFYGMRREVTSVRQAASLLGMKQIVQIALTVLSSRYLGSAQSGYELGAGELWRSSLTSAIAAELLAEAVQYRDPSAAYTAGLLQDIGKIVLAEFVGDALPRIWKLIDEESLGFEAAERRVVGMDHAHVGALLLERWKFPAALVESVRTHHAPEEATVDPVLARISHLADALTMTVGMGLGADGMAYALEPEVFDALGLGESSRIDALIEALAEKISQASSLFGAVPGQGAT